MDNNTSEEIKAKKVGTDPKTGITTSDLENPTTGVKIGHMKHTETPEGQLKVVVGRIGPKAAKAMTSDTEEKSKRDEIVNELRKRMVHKEQEHNFLPEPDAVDDVPAVELDIDDNGMMKIQVSAFFHTSDNGKVPLLKDNEALQELVMKAIQNETQKAFRKAVHGVLGIPYDLDEGGPMKKPLYVTEKKTLEEWLGMMEEAGINLDEAWGTSPTPYTDSVPRGRMVKNPAGQSNWQDYTGAEKDALRQQQSANIRTQHAAAQSAANTAKATGASASTIWRAQGAMKDAETRAKETGTKLSQTPLPTGAKPTGTFKPTTTDTKGAPVPPTQKPKAGEPGGLPLPPKKPQPQMASESYTLEEWMGMLEEAGYNLEEGFMDTLRRGASSVAGAVGKGLEKVGLKKSEEQKAREEAEKQRAYQAFRAAGEAGARRMDAKYGHDARRAAERQADAAAAQRQRDSVSGIQSIAAKAKAQADADAAASQQRAAERAAERQRRQSGTTQESYTLEEWVGMLEAVGHEHDMEAIRKKLQQVVSARGADASVQKIRDALKAHMAARRAAKKEKLVSELRARMAVKEQDDSSSKEKTPSEETPKDKPKPTDPKVIKKAKLGLTPYDIAAAEYYRSKGYGPGSYTGD